MALDIERDIRDVTRSMLDAKTKNEFYATFYPKPETGTSPWGAISILTDEEITQIVLAYHLRRRYGIKGPADRADDFIRLVVSRDGIGRAQGVTSTISRLSLEGEIPTGAMKPKRTFFQRLFHRGD